MKNRYIRSAKYSYTLIEFKVRHPVVSKAVSMVAGGQKFM